MIRARTPGKNNYLGLQNPQLAEFILQRYLGRGNDPASPAQNSNTVTHQFILDNLELLLDHVSVKVHQLRDRDITLKTADHPIDRSLLQPRQI